jgi:hypothetical protein
MNDYWMKNKTTKEVLEHFITRFARLNKDSYEAEHMVNEYTEILEARGKGPEVIIVPRGVEPLFTGAVNSDKLDIDKVGPELAEKRMLQVSERMTRFANLTMKFTRRYLNFIGGQLAADPLQRGRLFGEFVQLPPIRSDHKMFKDGYIYKTDDRQLQMMDYKLDAERTIGLKEVGRNLHCFNKDGYLQFDGGDSEPTSGRKPLNHKHVQGPFEYRAGNGNIYPCKLFGQVPLEFVSKQTLEIMADCLTVKTDKFGKSNKDTVDAADAALYENALFPSGVSIGGNDDLLRFAQNGFLDRLKESINGDKEVTQSSVYSGKKGLKYTSLGSSYGRFLQSIKPTHVSVDLKQKADSVLTQLTSLNAHVPYGTLLSKLESDELKNAAIERSYYLLSRTPEEIKQELLEPLNAIQNPSATITKTEAVKQEKKLISQLTAPVPQHVSSSLQVVDPLVSNGYDIFSDNDIKEAQSRGLEFEQVTKLPSGLNSPEDVMTFFNTLDHKIHTAAGLKEPSWKTKEDTGAQDIFYRIKEYGTITVGMALLLFQRLNDKFFQILHDYDIYDPFHYIICRPYVHVVTNTVLIGTGGSRLGNTLIRQPDVMLKDNAVDKTHLVFMTMYNTAVVFNHLLMCCVDDVSIHSYLGNGNTRFITAGEFASFSENNFEIPEDDNYGALYVLIAATKENDRIPSVFSLDRSLLDDPDNKDAEPVIYFHDNVHLSQYIKQTPNDNHPYFWNDQVANRVVCQIPQRLLDPVSGEFKLYISGEISHLGGNHYRGMIRDLKSGKRLLKKNDLANPEKYKPWYDL